MNRHSALGSAVRRLSAAERLRLRAELRQVMARLEPLAAAGRLPEPAERTLRPSGQETSAKPLPSWGHLA